MDGPTSRSRTIIADDIAEIPCRSNTMTSPEHVERKCCL